MHALLLLALLAQDKPDEARLYTYQIQQHKAQVVMLSEEKLISPDLARQLARAIPTADRETRAQVVPLREDYAAFERKLIAAIGPEASNLHLGRSNNDMGATSERLFLRDDALEILAAMAQARAALLSLARDNVGTVIPGFTHMVQAQPTTLAHQYAAFLSALERDEQRLREALARIERSPLGVGAFTTSSFQLNRQRLQELMGLPGLVENGYDAIMVSTVDTKAEFAAALSLSALNVGRFIQQFLIQYSDSHPGISIADNAVGHSSIMPQKRNPSDGERIRLLCSSIVADAHAVTLMAHNTPGGEHKDIRFELLERAERVSKQSKLMYTKFGGFLKTLRVNPERTLELVTHDYSVLTELADTLLRESKLPFRLGHQVAAAVADFGRAHNKRPMQITFEEFQQLYRKTLSQETTLTASQFQRAMDPRAMIAARQGSGGPQPAEMQRQLAQHERRLTNLRTWLAQRQQAIQEANAKLEFAFTALGN